MSTTGNTEVEEEQAGIKIAGRNINNLRYEDDSTLVVESEEELKSLLMKVKEESEKAHSFMCFLAICMSIWQRRHWPNKYTDGQKAHRNV